MMEQLTATKPSRSDEILDGEEQVRIANQIRAEFDALEPKRPIKPNRSEPDALPQHPAVSLHDIPELHKFQSLQSRPHHIISSAGVVDAQDEFVETQYYTELASIDKQHHTTGSGFIKAVREGGEGGYEIQLPDTHAQIHLQGYKSNPATNDWVPNFDPHQVFVSSKPNRSEKMGCSGTTVVVKYYCLEEKRVSERYLVVDCLLNT
ncbi:hypothetical protein CR513_61214 [Mucuna pruriens]|uniref:Uncharacterized protein n=1 Tax=Mucuna pruriens TaxID=157652 RepID=A0A371E3L5_MUCPR|nr:hypothetical protein CR513_61214 [Mucuna pruriens]